MSEQKMQAIVIGDWSDDGHGKSDTFYFTSNKTTPEIQEAYRQSVAKTGFTFSHAKKGQTSLVCHYEDDKIYREQIEELAKFGDVKEALKEADPDEDGCYRMYSESVFSLIVWFIKLSLPDLEIEQCKPEFINGWWGPLNEMWGYGVYT